MRIETSLVQKLTIREAEGLDPIDVFLEDHGAGRGKITLNCYGKSWTSYWGSMGTDIRSFFLSCDEHYLIRNLSVGLAETQFSGEALAQRARQVVLGRRRSSLQPTWDEGYDTYDAAQARELYDQIEEALSDVTDIWQAPSALMTELFGEEYWYASDRATEPNPDYRYLARIIQAVQAALKTLPAPTVAEAA